MSIAKITTNSMKRVNKEHINVTTISKKLTTESKLIEKLHKQLRATKQDSKRLALMSMIRVKSRRYFKRLRALIRIDRQRIFSTSLEDISKFRLTKGE